MNASLNRLYGGPPHSHRPSPVTRRSLKSPSPSRPSTSQTDRQCQVLKARYRRYVWKRRRCQHEQEVRATISTHGDVTGALGPSVPVDLTTLVRHVHVAPTATAWYEDVVRRAVERCGLDASVTRSDLCTGLVN